MNFQNQVDYLQTIYQSDMFDGASLPSPLVRDDAVSAIMQRCGLLEPQYSEPAIMHQLVTLWFRTNQWNFQHLVNIILAEYSPIENTDRYSEHTQDSEGVISRSINRSSNSQETHGGTDARTISNSGTDEVSESHGGTDSRVINKETVTANEEIHSGTDSRIINKETASTGQEQHSGTDARTEIHSGTDITESTTSAYNSSAYQPADKTETTHGEQITDNLLHGETIDTTGSGTDDTTDALTHGETINNSGSGSDDTTDALTHGETIDTETTYGRTTTDNLQHGETISNTGSGTESIEDSSTGSQSYTEHTHGNIGVTTNQELISQELRLLMRFNVYEWIAAKFEKDLMIQVY